MNHTTTRWSHLIRGFLLLGAVVTSTSQAAGLLSPADGRTAPLNIREQHVEVTIENGYAITRVEQVFHNPHAQDLEAVYSFPVPKHGSVAEFTMWIDGKPISGEVMEKKQARQVYEEEKQKGRESGIAEKDSYKTFDISVSPVRANQDARIRLVYLQPAHVDTGIGRYVYPLEEGGVDEQKLAFWTRNDKVLGAFTFDLILKSGYPVDGLRLPQHGQAQITQVSPNEWRAHIDANAASPPTQPVAALSHVAAINNAARGEERSQPGNTPVYALDKDIVVYWRLIDGLPGAVDLVPYKPDAKGRGTFMMTITPGDDLQPITEGRDWIFVLDVSGSMNGKYATLSEGVQRALQKLNPQDRFRIVLFNNRARELTSGYVNATPENVRQLCAAVAQVQPSDGTNLYAGLELGLSAMQADRTSAIVLVTDGVANVGETQQRQFLKLVQNRDVRLFTFIMGNSANTPLLDALAKHSGGFALSISNSDDIAGKLLEATSKVTHAALHDVKVEIDGVKTADLIPGTIHTLYRGDQLVLFGHYWGQGEAKVRLSGKVSGQPKVYETRFAFAPTATDNPELERLWAYATIEEMTADMEDFGEKADLKQAVVDLGVEYGLVTNYTSMIVLREEAFAERGIARTNAKRLALEQQAQHQRTLTAPQSRRVDQNQPMFNAPRPSFSSGGGSVDAWVLLALLGAMTWRLYRYRAYQT